MFAGYIPPRSLLAGALNPNTPPRSSILSGHRIGIPTTRGHRPRIPVMNDTTQIVPLNKQSISSYANAVRQLRRKVGAKAPTIVELINFELAGRNPRDIASCFLDHLRDLERRRHVEPGHKLGRRVSTPLRVPLLRQTPWPSRRQPVAVNDPARN